MPETPRQRLERREQELRNSFDGQARHWALRYHYACPKCDWFALKSDYPEEPRRCPKCGAEPK